MDWKIVVDGVGKATLAVFLVEILARLAMSFNVPIPGLMYLDILFAALLVLTIAGYGIYYGRTYGAPVSIVAASILGVAGFIMMVIALLGFPSFASPMRMQLFWVGVLLLAVTIPIGSYASRKVRSRWHGYETDFRFGHHGYNLMKDYDGCADGSGAIAVPTFLEPVVSADGGSCVGAGVRIDWERDSIVFKDGPGSVAVAGRGDIDTSWGTEHLDGLCVVSSACPLEVKEGSTRAATDADAWTHDFKGLAELREHVATASANIPSEAETFLKEAMSKYNPGEKVETVNVGGVVNVEQSAARKVVRVPGVYVYEGPEGQVVRVGGKVVKNEIKSQESTMGFGGLYKEGEKPVTVMKNLSEGLSFVVMGPRWAAWKKDEKVGS